MKLSPSHEFSSALNPCLHDFSSFASLWLLEEEEEEELELEFDDPLCSLELQKERTVTLENLNEVDEEAESDWLLEPEPDAWLELLLDDCDELLDEVSSEKINPAKPLSPLQSLFT